jgi:hypothetical protein
MKRSMSCANWSVNGVWFAEPLLSSATTEVQLLLVQARVWAERLGKQVRLWMSDKQDAFVRGIAAEFQGVPHRYCANHFLRDVAKPVLEADSRAKVQMRRTVRGLRALEREVVSERRSTNLPGLSIAPMEERRDTLKQGEALQDTAARVEEATKEVVLDYCAAVRGILNDDQGGPLHPPGLRMAEALGDVQASLHRNLEAKKGGLLTTDSRGWPDTSAGG